MAESSLNLIMDEPDVNDHGPPRVLATDLDGTFIPLDNDATNESDLVALTRLLDASGVTLVFVTGRHLESVQDVIAEKPLPHPDWLICDVGTSIYHADRNGELQISQPYVDRLNSIVGDYLIERLRSELISITELRLQEESKQGRFKLSYYCDAKRCDELADRIQRHLGTDDAPYGIIQSVDPFNGDGLIDLVPVSVSKAFALNWWSDHLNWDRRSIVFAGDSGNDFAALTAGFRSILVANADAKLIDHVRQVHTENGWRNRLIVSESKATSGVLDGIRRYLTGGA